MISRRAALLAAALAMVAAPACQTVSRGVDKAEGAVADVFLPPDEEQKLGEQIEKEVEQQARLSTDREVVSYVQSLGQKVAATSPNPDKWKFEFKVIDDPKTVNAFAIPGGTIYVYTGLLEAAKDEAEVAGVLAHEVAHVTSRHIAKRLVEAYGLQTIAGLALGQDPGLVSQIAAAIVVNGTLLRNSRADESEADAKGVVATAQAGYDPAALVDFFRTLKGESGNTPRVLTFLSDHPAPEDRIAALESIIQRRGLGGGERNPQALERVQARI